MTVNQLRYHELQETRRSNLARETETKRSNLAKEHENTRSNVAKEEEVARHNLVSESQEGQRIGLTQREVNANVDLKKAQTDHTQSKIWTDSISSIAGAVGKLGGLASVIGGFIK